MTSRLSLRTLRNMLPDAPESPPSPGAAPDLSTLAARYEWLRAQVPDMTHADVDGLCAWNDYANKIARGLEPRDRYKERLAQLFGARPGWLAFGEGEPPTPRAVRRAVEKAKQARARAGA